jgi:hypothetical protein
MGVVLSSLLVLFKYKFVFALQGLLSGVFFVLSFINTFRAVRLLGVAGSNSVFTIMFTALLLQICNSLVVKILHCRY